MPSNREGDQPEGDFEHMLCQVIKKDPSQGVGGRFECLLCQATKKDQPGKPFEYQLPEARKRP